MASNEKPQLDRVLDVSVGARKYWEQYQESHASPLLTHVGYELVRGGVSGPELTVYLEQSGIDTNGVKHIRDYIEHYDKPRKDAYFVPRGEGESAELPEEKKQSLLNACDSFRGARSGQWETDDLAAGRQIRKSFTQFMGREEEK